MEGRTAVLQSAPIGSLFWRALSTIANPGAELKLAKPLRSWAALALFVGLMGLLRGLLETADVLLRAGHLLVTLTQPYALAAFAGPGAAFVVANVVTAFGRWAMFAFVLFAVGRWLGGNGRFDELLRRTAPAMILYPLTILPDFAYLFWSLPAIRFDVAPIYHPVLGIGQLAASAWLTWFGYQAARRLHGLGRLDSVFAGAALELASVGSLVAGAILFFNLPPVRALDRDGVVLVATGCFTVVAVAAAIFFLRLGRRLDLSRG